MDEIQGVEQQAAPKVPTQKIGIIDCGTNTFNLLVAEVSEDHKWTVLFENKIPVKLGAGGFDKKTIVPSRFIRGLDALHCHANNMRNFEVSKAFAFATSAVREAENGNDFVKLAKSQTGIEIDIIDGQKEAELIWKGIRQTIDLGDSPALIMDIGGGSTEFIIANNSTIFWKKSYLLGVSRLHEKINPSDRINHDEVGRLRKILEREFVDLKAALAEHPCDRIVGSSGSFDTLTAMYQYNTKQLNTAHFELCNEIPMDAFPSIHQWLMGSTFAERMKHRAIPSVRAEYMPLASYMVKYVLELQNFNKMYHSAYALKEGAIADLVVGSRL
jgi:exopolyphosphatase / guanosine-5'-triphosphate,3'-diphosphate pyrophosphatase